MRVRALESFAGAVNMAKGTVCEIADRALAEDLIRAGYAEEVPAEDMREPARTARRKGARKDD